MTRRFNGWRLAAYDWEHETFPEFRKVTLDHAQAYKYLKKFSRHFKTTCPHLQYGFRRGGGGHYTPTRYGIGSIKLGKNPSFGTVCHEYAHHLETVRHNSKRWHGKQFKRELKRVYTFAKRYLPKDHLLHEVKMVVTSNNQSSFLPETSPSSSC